MSFYLVDIGQSFLPKVEHCGHNTIIARTDARRQLIPIKYSNFAVYRPYF